MTMCHVSLSKFVNQWEAYKGVPSVLYHIFVNQRWGRREWHRSSFHESFSACSLLSMHKKELFLICEKSHLSTLGCGKFPSTARKVWNNHLYVCSALCTHKEILILERLSISSQGWILFCDHGIPGGVGLWGSSRLDLGSSPTPTIFTLLTAVTHCFTSISAKVRERKGPIVATAAAHSASSARPTWTGWRGSYLGHRLVR